MSNALWPVFNGLEWEYVLTPQFSSGVQQATSGREVRTSYWVQPLHKIQLSYSFLFDDSIHGVVGGFSQIQQLVGFFYARQGSFDSFLIDLSTLNRKSGSTTLTGQNIGTGDGSTTQFQIVRNYGGTLVPVQEPMLVSTPQTANIYVNGVLKTAGADYTIAKGIVTFTAAPGNTLPITADFTWYLRVRFNQDSLDFKNFLYLLWECKQVELMEVRS